MNYYFIVNKWAGAKHSARTWSKLRKLLKTNDVQYDFKVTEYPKHATEIAKDFANQHPTDWVVVAVGGDGTLFEVVDGVQNANQVVPVGYIPAGSGNDFAREVGISTKPYPALKQLIGASAITTLDIGVYQRQLSENVHYFTNNVGVGFDANIVHQANVKQKKKLSWLHLESLSYVGSILRTLFRQKGFKFKVNIDGEEHEFEEAFVVSITNIKYFGGGVSIAPLAKLNDGKLDVIITEKLNIFKFIYLFMRLKINGSHLKMKDVFFETGQKIRIQSIQKEYGQVNGEDLGKKAFDIRLWVTQQPFWFNSDRL